ncbi:MAG: chemotaxis protein CheX [Deltaproteobacteria bacterium]|nr:chemotaxis protein CheX [Deltaproteobacteria bacterium]
METMRKMMEISIFEVFEKMFFIFLEHAGDADNHFDSEAVITFRGAVSGEVRLLVSDGMAGAMVMNMLGIDDTGITEKHIEDCAKEAVNMICGNFLGKLHTDDQAFDLSIPLYRRPASSVAADGDSTVYIHYLSGDGAMSTALQVSAA